MSHQKKQTKKTCHFNYDMAKDLYYQIRAIYNSPYLEEENYEIIIALMQAVNEDKVNPEYLLYKAKLLSQEQKEFKQKLCNLIKAKFWI